MSKRYFFVVLSGDNAYPISNFQWLKIKDYNVILDRNTTLKKFYKDGMRERGYINISINIYIIDIKFSGEKCDIYKMVFNYIKGFVTDEVRDTKIKQILK